MVRSPVNDSRGLAKMEYVKKIGSKRMSDSSISFKFESPSKSNLRDRDEDTPTIPHLYRHKSALVVHSQR